MFSLMSLCLFMGGPHGTIIPDSLDLTVQSPWPQPWRPSEHQTWDPSPWACPLWTSDMGPLLLVTSGGHPTRPVQTCLYKDPYQCWHPVAKARTVGKRVVCILPECSLVYVYLHFVQIFLLKIQKGMCENDASEKSVLLKCFMLLFWFYLVKNMPWWDTYWARF